MNRCHNISICLQKVRWCLHRKSRTISCSLTHCKIERKKNPIVLKLFNKYIIRQIEWLPQVTNERFLFRFLFSLRFYYQNQSIFSFISALFRMLYLIIQSFTLDLTLKMRWRWTVSVNSRQIFEVFIFISFCLYSQCGDKQMKIGTFSSIYRAHCVLLIVLLKMI